MAHYSRAFLAHVLGSVKALLTPARGRHSARRRRSARVRRYAPNPAPAQAPSSGRAFAQADAPRLAPPTTRPAAGDITFVRPYYVAHEREMARIQERADARLRAWTAPAPIFTPVPPHSSGGSHFTLDDFAPPRVPAPRVPSRFEELPHLARIRQRQQQHGRATAGQGVEVGV